MGHSYTRRLERRPLRSGGGPGQRLRALVVINENSATRIEQRNGTNWSISSPDAGTAFNALYAVTP
jgi:hypothetical protein